MRVYLKVTGLVAMALGLVGSEWLMQDDESGMLAIPTQVLLLRVWVGQAEGWTEIRINYILHMFAPMGIRIVVYRPRTKLRCSKSCHLL